MPVSLEGFNQCGCEKFTNLLNMFTKVLVSSYSMGKHSSIPDPESGCTECIRTDPSLDPECKKFQWKMSFALKGPTVDQMFVKVRIQFFVQFWA